MILLCFVTSRLWTVVSRFDDPHHFHSSAPGITLKRRLLLQLALINNRPRAQPHRASVAAWCSALLFFSLSFSFPRVPSDGSFAVQRSCCPRSV